MEILAKIKSFQKGQAMEPLLALQKEIRKVKMLQARVDNRVLENTKTAEKHNEELELVKGKLIEQNEEMNKRIDFRDRVKKWIADTKEKERREQE